MVAARWLGALKQAKIQKSLPNDMKNKFEIYYQKLGTLAADMKAIFLNHFENTIFLFKLISCLPR